MSLLNKHVSSKLQDIPLRNMSGAGIGACTAPYSVFDTSKPCISHEQGYTHFRVRNGKKKNLDMKKPFFYCFLGVFLAFLPLFCKLFLSFFIDIISLTFSGKQLKHVSYLIFLYFDLHLEHKFIPL